MVQAPGSERGVGKHLRWYVRKGHAVHAQDEGTEEADRGGVQFHRVPHPGTFVGISKKRFGFTGPVGWRDGSLPRYGQQSRPAEMDHPCLATTEWPGLAFQRTRNALRFESGDVLVLEGTGIGRKRSRSLYRKSFGQNTMYLVS